jgi:LysM repeat protein
MTKRRPTLFRLAALAAVLLLALALAACTRERAAPETTDATGADATAATEPAGTPADTQATESPVESPVVEGGAGEPVVTVAPGDAEAEGTPTPAEGETSTGEHEVQSGETLMSIALLYDTDVETLRSLNFLPDDVIQVGQRLLVPITPPTPTPTPAPFIYVVQDGDTLFSLVRRFGVAAEDLVTANNITDPNTLVPGTELIIPGYVPEGTAPVTEGTEEGGEGAAGGAPAAGAGELVQHVVQPGETFSEIAQQYGVDEEELAAANGITNRNQLRSGQTLTIPGLTQAQLREAQTVTHTVAQGETLSEIAQQYGVDAGVIIEANGLANPNDIRVGQELRIPPP